MKISLKLTNDDVSGIAVYLGLRSEVLRWVHCGGVNGCGERTNPSSGLWPPNDIQANSTVRAVIQTSQGRGHHCHHIPEYDLSKRFESSWKLDGTFLLTFCGLVFIEVVQIAEPLVQTGVSPPGSTPRHPTGCLC